MQLSEIKIAVVMVYEMTEQETSHSNKLLPTTCEALNNLK